MKIPDGKFRELLMQAVGARLRDLRRERSGLTQTALARDSRVTRASVSAIEAGQQGVSVEKLCRLALALDVAPAAILPDREELIQMLADSGSSMRAPEEIADDFLREKGGDYG